MLFKKSISYFSWHLLNYQKKTPFIWLLEYIKNTYKIYYFIIIIYFYNKKITKFFKIYKLFLSYFWILTCPHKKYLVILVDGVITTVFLDLVNIFARHFGLKAV